MLPTLQIGGEELGAIRFPGTVDPTNTAHHIDPDDLIRFKATLIARLALARAKSDYTLALVDNMNTGEGYTLLGPVIVEDPPEDGERGPMIYGVELNSCAPFAVPLRFVEEVLILYLIPRPKPAN